MASLVVLAPAALAQGGATSAITACRGRTGEKNPSVFFVEGVVFDKSLNSNYWFNERNGLPPSDVRLNQYGARLGGPIARNKAFFFAHYDSAFRKAATSPRPTAPTASSSSLVITRNGPWCCWRPGSPASTSG